MANRTSVARARTPARSRSDASQIRELVHSLHNNLAALDLWLSSLLEQPCPECHERFEEVAAAIRRNVTAMRDATRKVNAVRKPRRRSAARSGAAESALRYHRAKAR
jgi:hypothetical protein